MIEVERKFRISSPDDIVRKLVAMGYEASDPVHQIDKVYLVKSESFKTFKSGDPVARIRTVEGVSHLAFKRALNTSGDSIEHEMTVDPVAAAEGLLRVSLV